MKKAKFIDMNHHNKKPIKITAQIGGKIVTIEAKNRETAGELLRRFKALHPEINGLTKPEITYETPKRTPRLSGTYSSVKKKKKKLK
jgi:hypothetical protein